MEEIIPSINYQNEQERCLNFLQKFNLRVDSTNEGSLFGNFKYMTMLKEVSMGMRKSIVIEMDDVMAFGESGDFCSNIQKNSFRYIELFSRAVDRLLPTPTVQDLIESENTINTIIGHRLLRKQELDNHTEDSVGQEKPTFPPDIIRTYVVHLRPVTNTKPLSIRDVKSVHIGSLVKVKAIVIRVSEVKPMITICTFVCERCGYEIYQEITTPSFTPLAECPTNECRANNIKGDLFMQTRGSKFVKFQEIRLQEQSDQVPVGHMPKTMTVYAYEDLTSMVSPGDSITISGIFIPRPYMGFRSIRAGLLTDVYIHACHIEFLKQKDSHILNDPMLTEPIIELSKEKTIYERLANSIAPEIFGHEDVKKALLLMMVGGVSRAIEDGMKIRGNANMCLMGDPGVAKSQLLKCIAKISLRGLYTTGKGSSGVGLTAAVIKDPITNEMVLEGGALVLADNGICCIDEFDKIDEDDRTSIHEVMEQQTISISKAGITTTLNARTSILAAANPTGGTYNIKKSPSENINMPYALLSRFDIVFLMLDKPDRDNDIRMANHVLNVHKSDRSCYEDVIPSNILRAYIAYAKQFEPSVPQSLVEHVSNTYVGLRTTDVLGKDFYTTPRTLTTIIRLSQALARLRFANEVSKEDVSEAMRLLESSRSSILSPEGRSTTTSDPMTKIYTIIMKCLESNVEVQEIPLDLIKERVLGSGFNLNQLEDCISMFSKASVWSLSSEGTTLIIYN